CRGSPSSATAPSLPRSLRGAHQRSSGPPARVVRRLPAASAEDDAENDADEQDDEQQFDDAHGSAEREDDDDSDRGRDERGDEDDLERGHGVGVPAFHWLE